MGAGPETPPPPGRARGEEQWEVLHRAADPPNQLRGARGQPLVNISPPFPRASGPAQHLPSGLRTLRTDGAPRPALPPCNHCLWWTGTPAGL